MAVQVFAGEVTIVDKNGVKVNLTSVETKEINLLIDKVIFITIPVANISTICLAEDGTTLLLKTAYGQELKGTSDSKLEGTYELGKYSVALLQIRSIDFGRNIQPPEDIVPHVAKEKAPQSSKPATTVPIESKTTFSSVHERAVGVKDHNDRGKNTLGLWAVNVPSGKQKLLIAWNNACAVTKDKKIIATLGFSKEEEEVNRREEHDWKKRLRFLEGSVIRVGSPGGKLRTLWESSDKVGTSFPHRGTSIMWSASGKRLFVTDGGALLVLDLTGQHKLLGQSAENIMVFDRNNPERAWEMINDPAKPYMKNARWAGRSDTEIVVGCKDSMLRVLNVQTGNLKRLCPYPPDFNIVTGKFEVSDDLSTVVFFSSARVEGFRSNKENKNGGLWIWHRGQKTPIQIAPGDGRSGALSGNGKYVIVDLGLGLWNDSGDLVFPSRLRLYETATGKMLWEKTEGYLSYINIAFAFDSTQKNLAIVLGKNLYYLFLDDLNLYPLGEIGVFSLSQLAWSSDGTEILFRLFYKSSFHYVP